MAKRMGCSVWVLSLSCLVVAALIVSPATGLSCGDAVSALIPCGSYLVGAGAPQPSSQCCASARSLNKLAATPASRQQLCECFKSTGPSFGVKTDRAKQLPALCKLNLNIAISPDVNCKNV
uniref:Non-specific lipid-transfer protein n=1 Tax=Nelumbo nucifera TaxID=4432 RepID=A0A822XT48_NELNU|nr:TPA_asm: hypothetical protein HUJ06_024970 [Nelumbo nucifera]